MKKFLMVLGVLVLAALGIVVYLWNKPHKTVEGESGQKITADSLSNAFVTDEATANRAFLNNVLSVTGTVAEVTTNLDGKTVVLLEGTDLLSGVQCTMKEVADFQVGQQVSIKGFCHGYTLVVLLSECVIE